MSRPIVDIELLMLDLLRARLPAGTPIMLTRDADTPLDAVAVLVAPVAGIPFSNGPAVMGAVWTIAVSVCARSEETASDLAATTCEAIESAETTVVPGVGFISSVDVALLPTRSPTSTLGAPFVQYDAQYRVRVRPL